MRRLLSFTAPLLAALALPALAQANTGTVLSASKAHHQVQLISSNKTVHAFGYRGKLRGLERGAELSYTAAGSRIKHAKVIGNASSRNPGGVTDPRRHLESSWRRFPPDHPARVVHNFNGPPGAAGEGGQA